MTHPQVRGRRYTSFKLHSSCHSLEHIKNQQVINMIRIKFVNLAWIRQQIAKLLTLIA